MPSATFSTDRSTWAVADLWEAAHGITAVYEEVAALPGVESIQAGLYWCEDGFDGMTEEERAEHEARIEQADLSYPIILTPEGKVADGAHRVCKCLRLGVVRILAVRLPCMPPPCNAEGSDG